VWEKCLTDGTGCNVYAAIQTSPGQLYYAGTQINDLIALVRSYGLLPALENTLVGKLQDALAAVNAGNTAAACSSLTSFLSKVQSQSDKKIAPDQKSELISSANQIKTKLGCP
jgi:hypothetical protein